jgi:TolA-binding protein
MFDYLRTRYPAGAYFWKAELEAGNALSAKGHCAEAIKRYEKVIGEAPMEQKVLAKFSVQLEIYK